MTRTTAAAAGSLAALGLLFAALHWRSREAPTGRPLVVYCAAATRVPMEATAAEYEAETGRRVELRLGASEEILAGAGMVNPSDPADLFLPADESYVRLARDRGLVAETIPVATMRAVVLTAPGNPKGLAAWPDLLREGVRVAVPGRAAAVGKLARDHLAAAGKWIGLQPRVVVEPGRVDQAAAAARVGSVDAAVVWDAVAAGYPGQAALPLPELAGVTARVEVAVLTQSADPAAALRLARYLSAADRGLRHFRSAGFRVAEPGSVWGAEP